MLSQEVNRREGEKKVGDQGRGPGVILGNALSEKERREVNSPDDGAEKCHGRVVRKEEQCATYPAQSASRYLEDRRAFYLARLESIAEQAESDGDLDTATRVYLSLLRLSSLGRVRVDLKGELERLIPLPDLSQVSDEQLEAMIARASPSSRSGRWPAMTS